jgi:CubicO group peptidase (beta-lactamase class C family)
MADLANGTPVTPGTLFELASISKTMTAAAVLLLEERKKLSLGDDVRAYVPELPEYDKGRPIRLEDLLRHVSGLPDYLDFEDVTVGKAGFLTNADYVGEFARRLGDDPLQFPTGQEYDYNNSNYLLLAVVIERVAGRSYGAFLREELFRPAGMTSTFVYDAPASVPEGAAARSAIGYVRRRRGWRPKWGLPPRRQERELTVGDGGVWSDLRDVAAWDAALRGGKVISDASLQRALTRTKVEGGEEDYGLGFGLYFTDAGGINGFGHDGDWGGFINSYYHQQVDDLTTVILSNRGDFDINAFWEDLYERIKTGRLG